MWASDPSASPTKVSPEVIFPWVPGWPPVSRGLAPYGALPSSGRGTSQDGQQSAEQMAGPPEGLTCQVSAGIHESGLWLEGPEPGTSLESESVQGLNLHSQPCVASALLRSHPPFSSNASCT